MLKHLLSMDEVSIDDIISILKLSEDFENKIIRQVFNYACDKILATLFYEPSTRTRLSFESAMIRSGGSIIGFSDSKVSSVSKGETISDTIRTVANYCDIIVMRHSIEGAARVASEVSSVPIINAGDGANQHPSQTLLDLYTLKNIFGSINAFGGHTIGFVGDLKYSRTVHSLIPALINMDEKTFILISPQELCLDQSFVDRYRKDGVILRETSSIKHINDCDIIYVTRIQQERFPDQTEYEKVKNVYRITADMLKPGLKVLHPLPRVNEISTCVDKTDHAEYFNQVRNGVFVRQAIIHKILGEE